jgi:hypothetical protein
MVLTWWWVRKIYQHEGLMVDAGAARVTQGSEGESLKEG